MGGPYGRSGTYSSRSCVRDNHRNRLAGVDRRRCQSGGPNQERSMNKRFQWLRASWARSLAAAFTCCARVSLIAVILPSGAAAQAVPRIFNDVAIAPEFGAKVPLDLQFVDADGR